MSDARRGRLSLGIALHVLYLRKVGIAFAPVHAIAPVTAVSFEGCFTILPNVAVGIRTIAKELIVPILILEAQDAFSPIVTLVTILVGTGFIFLVAEDPGPS